MNVKEQRSMPRSVYSKQEPKEPPKLFLLPFLISTGKKINSSYFLFVFSTKEYKKKGMFENEGEKIAKSRVSLLKSSCERKILERIRSKIKTTIKIISGLKKATFNALL